jgi:hypothetical protein
MPSAPNRRIAKAFGTWVSGSGIPDDSRGKLACLSRLCLTSGCIIWRCPTNPWGVGRASGVVSIGDLMAFDAAIADRPLSRRRRGWSETIVLGLAAVALSLGAAAWITDSDLSTLASAALPPTTDRISSFEDRFLPASSIPTRPGLQALDRSALAAVQTKVRAAQDLLAQKLMSPDLRGGFVAANLEEPKVEPARPAPTTVIPLPRSRPAAAGLAPVLAQGDNGAGLEERPAPQRRADDRSLFEKLQDRLASLAPEVGMFHRPPDLAALGYDNVTAVYDITAHAVYLPNGTILEAHSGMGALRDDPEHVSVAMQGATPPATYDLKPRETPFHGVQALRMTPAEGSDVSGRSGLLTHTYMLGPKGDSNGCVSIRDYDRFLKAYNNGEFTRLVVVPSLRAATMASRA